MLEISKRGGQRRGGEGAEEVLLINPLDKQPAPNTSCLDDEAGWNILLLFPPPSSGKPIQQRARGNSGLKESVLWANPAGRNEINGRCCLMENNNAHCFLFCSPKYSYDCFLLIHDGVSSIKITGSNHPSVTLP